MSEGQLLTWCVVANVLAETLHGEGGEDVQRGLKHFAPGAKVWVLPPQWGDGGEKLVVVGRHRGRGNQQIRLVLDRRFLTNYRVKPLYQQAIHDLLTKPVEGGSGRLWESKEHAEDAARFWQDHPTPARYRSTRGQGPWWTTDPPQAVLYDSYNEVQFHFVEFTGRVAWYEEGPPRDGDGPSNA